MDLSAISFRLFRRGGNGIVTGFSLMAYGDEATQDFCTSFPLAFKTMRADIDIHSHPHGAMVFEHGGLFFPDLNYCRYRGQFRVLLTQEESDAIWKLFFEIGRMREGMRFFLRTGLALVKGFYVTIES